MSMVLKNVPSQLANKRDSATIENFFATISLKRLENAEGSYREFGGSPAFSSAIGSHASTRVPVTIDELPF